MIVANTKQIRAIVNAVIDEQGSTKYGTWSDAPTLAQTGTTSKRYVTYWVTNPNLIRVFAQDEAKRLGYSNEFRVSKRGYLRVTSFVA